MNLIMNELNLIMNEKDYKLKMTQLMKIVIMKMEKDKMMLEEVNKKVKELMFMEN